MLQFSLFIFSAFLAKNVAAIDPITVQASVLEGSDRTGDIGIYRFSMSLSEGSTIRTYFADELKYSGNILNDVEHCKINLGEATLPLEGCRFNPGSNSIELPIPDDKKPTGPFFYEIGGMKNPATS